MDTVYLVLWRGDARDSWVFDGLYATKDHAQAKLTLECMDHPAWEHIVVPVDVPARVTALTSAQ